MIKIRESLPRALACILLSFLLSACKTADGNNSLAPCIGPLEPGIHECGLESGEHNRYYQLRIPKDYAGQPIPLVLDLHGFGSPVVLGLSGERLVSGIDKVAKAEGFAVAWPQGLKNEWNSKPSNDLGLDEIDDVAFLLTLVEELSANINIDTSRIYVMGISNGGAMAQVLACEAADIFAAASTVAFQLPMNPSACTPSQSIPVIAFHAPTDILVPFDGTHTGLPHSRLSAPESYAAWANINGCVDDTNTYFEKGNSTCESHSTCTDGTEVAFCSIDGAGHFLGGHLTYINNDQVRLSAMIWEFFSKFSR